MSKNLKFGIGNVVAWGDEAPACLWHLWSSRDWKCESSIRKRKLQFSSNSSQIDLSSLTHSVPWVVEELDAVDSERYPWFYSGWLLTGRCIEWHYEEMIQSSFFERFQIMMFLRYFFVTTSSVFCFLFFFKVQSKIGVRMIHRRALYKGKYGICPWMMGVDLYIPLINQEWGHYREISDRRLDVLTER